MVKRQQAWVGMAFGSLGLLVLFGVLFALSGGSGIAFDGDQVETATQDEAGAVDGSDVVGDVAMSGTDGQVRSFAADGDGSSGGGNGTGLALRVVTDGGPTGSMTSEGANPSSSSSTTSTTMSAAGSETSSATSTTVSAGFSSSTSPTTAASSSTAAARESTTIQRQTTTAKASSSSSQTTVSTTTSTTATTATTAAPTTRPPTTSGSSSNARNFEQEVIRLTNEERAAGGCGPLTNNDKLHKAALGHSVDMAENDYFSHTSQDGSSMVDRVEREGYRWRSLAENIAAGYRSPAAVVDGWMNSSGHRANIMNCALNEIGVGFHNHYWTQNFGTPR